MFDAMVLRKPIVLFAKDRERYLRERRMYYAFPSDYSNYFCETEKELPEMIEAARWDEKAESLRQMYAGACDGHSTERVIDLIRSML